MHAPESRRSSPTARLVPLLAPMLLVGLFVACGGDSPTAPHPSLSSGNGPKGNNATIRVTPASATLNALHDTLQLTANVAVTWTSLDPGVATVDESGRVISEATGLARIEATAGHKADTAQVLVRQVLAFIDVTPDTMTIPLQTAFGDPGTGTLSALVADSNGFGIPNVPVTWVSDATAVATVADGVVTAVDTGTTTIRATAGSFTDTARVTVKDIPMPYP